MKSLRSVIGLVVLIVAGVMLTLASSAFIRPLDCRALCDAPQGSTCPTGTCRAYEQRAGLPLPYLIDDPGGGSPTSGWGILGPEDLPNPLFFLLDVAFYVTLLGLAAYLVLLRPAPLRELDRLPIVLGVALLLASLLGGFLLYRPFLAR
jgi:hypothetical protein